MISYMAHYWSIVTTNQRTLLSVLGADRVSDHSITPLQHLAFNFVQLAFPQVFESVEKVHNNVGTVYKSLNILINRKTTYKLYTVYTHTVQYCFEFFTQREGFGT